MERFRWISVCRYLRYHFIILLVYLSTYLTYLADMLLFRLEGRRRTLLLSLLL